MECWKFMKAEKRGFVFNAVLPNAVFGPVLSSEQHGSTGAWIPMVSKGKVDVLKDLPPRKLFRRHVASRGRKE